MNTSVNTRHPANAPADPFRDVNFTPAERASVRARMEQAEAIASGMLAVYRGIAAALAAAVNGTSVLARRVRSAFMKPAHH